MTLAKTLLAALAATAAPLLAGPLATYTFTGTASGTVNNTPFTGATLTVTVTADPTLITQGGACQCSFLQVPTASALLTISGVGSGTFTHSTVYVFDAQDPAVFGGEVGFGVASDDITINGNDLSSTMFQNYYLNTSLGPVGHVSDPSVSDWLNIGTSFGTTTITRYTDVTFQAVVTGLPSATPEPATLTLVPVGLLVMLWRRRAA